MTRDLDTRLNALLPRLTEDDLLAGRGIGNEISFYIFDYDPASEVHVRQHIQSLLTHLPKRKPGLRVVHINLLELVLEYMRSRNLLDKSLAMGEKEGDSKLLKRLNKVVTAEKVRPLLIEKAKPSETDLVLISGVGSVFPLLRAHSLLNNIQAAMQHTPIVLFYPGRYDGKDLRLFGQSTLAKNYYRAFGIEK